MGTPVTTVRGATCAAATALCLVLAGCGSSTPGSDGTGGAAGPGTTSAPAASSPAHSAPDASRSASASTPTGAQLEVVAVGDIASSSGLDDRVAVLVGGMHPDLLLLLGDIAYSSGSPQDFARWFDPDWARFSGVWMAVPGNHEYRTPGVSGYRQRFDVPSGPLHSARVVDGWLVVGLDSETPDSAEQLAWLRRTLAEHDGTPAVVMWHRPRFSSGEHGDQEDTEPLWAAVRDDPDVQLLLWGHDHDYERMSVPVPGREPVTALVVGTGGGELRDTPRMVDRPWREHYVDHITGALDLHLAPDGFSWKFVDVDGAVLDSGSEQVSRPSGGTGTVR